MKKEFVPYDRALRMKQLGFNEPCLMVYNYKKQVVLNNKIPFEERTNQPNPYLCTAPLFQQAFRWFRDEYYINEVIHCGHLLGEWTYSFWSIPTRKITDKHIIRDNAIRKMNKEHFNAGKYKTREEAELACLEKLLSIVEQKQKKDGK